MDRSFNAVSRLMGKGFGALALLVSLLAGGLMATAPSAQAAQDGVLAKPTGAVILTLKGAIQFTNNGDKAEFDLAMLEKLKSRVAPVKTPWADKLTTYEGPLMSAVLNAVGANGTTMMVKAINDYVAEVPVDDMIRYPVILATTRDGKKMTVREKGPLFIIYPFDLDPSLQNEKIYNRSVWQVKEITVN